MSEVSPALSLPYIQQSQAQKHVTHNEALRVLDAVTQIGVLSASLTTPPATLATGDRFIVAAGASGLWAGRDANIAIFDGFSWSFFPPQSGWRVDVIPTGTQLRFDGSDWVPPSVSLQNVTQVGIASTSDDTNRLSVASPATLLTHAGNDHQLKINKASISDTGSLLFQNSFSGRAEMGLAGTDDFSVKVSADGNTFHDAMRVDATSGAIQLPQGQSYFDDVTIPDDTAHSFDIPWSDPSRILMWMGVDLVGHSFLFSITGPLAGAINFVPVAMTPGGLVSFSTGALTGTSGTDGALTVSIDISGGAPRMYIENRLGSDRLFTLSTLGR